jgi:hypothetical protein
MTLHPAYEPPPPPDDLPQGAYMRPPADWAPPSKGRAHRSLGGLLLVLFVAIFAGLAAAIIIAVENGNDVPRPPRVEQVDDPSRPGCE